MNIPILLANILTLLAFFVHTFIGDKELKIIQPDTETENWRDIQVRWTMARCGWHWISFDLLFASIGLGLINFTDFFKHEVMLLQILAVYFFGYAIVWVIAITISKRFPKNYLILCQWVLLLVIAGLIFWGIK